ncbi:S1 RNA-binding domain-containing protein [Candidatus Wolfebacteria bacterium]|nr:S1 RNA-binding domain-containing protein [Candidatus Wolfebacteria bacterium]
MAITEVKNTSPMEQLAKTETNLTSFLKEGDLLEVRLLAKTAKAVFFDLGKYGTGVVYGAELSNARDIIKSMNVSDSVSAKVIDLENEEGFIELSLVNAQAQKNWQVLRDIKESGEAITVKIKGANTGGLISEINEIKAFLPVSQLSSQHYPRIEKGDQNKILAELKKFVGEELKVKVIDVNPRTNKLIISEKEAVEENIKELINKYKVNDVIDGIISGIADFGAFVRFVDNPSVEGLIHISELDWRLIENPKEIVKVDETIKAKIIEIKDDKIFLSLKALKPNPWETASEKFKEGQEVEGVIYKTNPFGAYVDLGENLFGSIHVSEFGSLDELKKHLETGKKYLFIIDSLKPEDKRIVLKVKK